MIENKSGRQAVLSKSFIDCTGDADICVFSGEKTALCSELNRLAAWYYYFADNKVNLCMFGAADRTDGVHAEEIECKRYKAVDGK